MIDRRMRTRRTIINRVVAGRVIGGRSVVKPCVVKPCVVRSRAVLLCGVLLWVVLLCVVETDAAVAVVPGDPQSADHGASRSKPVATFPTERVTTPVMAAVLAGDHNRLAGLLEDPEVDWSGGAYNRPPLSIACRRGDARAAELLIAAAKTARGWASRGDLRGTEMVNHTSAGGVTPLMDACRSGDLSTVETVLAASPNLDARQRQGQTALIWAAAAGHDAVLRRLIDAGADWRATTDLGYSALQLAARQGHQTTCDVLIDAGADVNAAIKPKKKGERWPRNGLSPLMLAVESGHFALALHLVRRGADPNDQRSGYGPLHAMAYVRRPQLGDSVQGDPPPRGSGNVSAESFVREMVRLGADVNLRLIKGKRPKGQLNPKGATPFLMAAQTVDLPLMRWFVECGADPTISNDDQTTALMAAAGVGNHFVGEHPGTVAEVHAAIDWLLDLGLDINAVDSGGETAMHGAAYRCYPATVQYLMSRGAAVSQWNHVNQYGWTPLTIAKGYRPGSFKPDPPTIAAVRAALGGVPDARQHDPDNDWR